MSFEYVDHPPLDLPPQLAGLLGLQAFGVAPLVIGGVAAATVLSAILAKQSWSVGDYNNYMRMMKDLFEQWDKLGWDTGCWTKYPAKRTEWKALWVRFGKHYAQYPVIKNSIPIFGYDPAHSAEEGPARGFIADLRRWGEWLQKTCRGDIGITAGGLDPNRGATPVNEDGMGDIIKYGAFAIGGLVLLNVISGVRGALPPRR
jgi:hypothetical protein